MVAHRLASLTCNKERKKNALIGGLCNIRDWSSGAIDKSYNLIRAREQRIHSLCIYLQATFISSRSTPLQSKRSKKSIVSWLKSLEIPSDFLTRFIRRKSSHIARIGVHTSFSLSNQPNLTTITYTKIATFYQHSPSVFPAKPLRMHPHDSRKDYYTAAAAPPVLVAGLYVCYEAIGAVSLCAVHYYYRTRC